VKNDEGRSFLVKVLQLLFGCVWVWNRKCAGVRCYMSSVAAFVGAWLLQSRLYVRGIYFLSFVSEGIRGHHNFIFGPLKCKETLLIWCLKR